MGVFICHSPAFPYPDPDPDSTRWLSVKVDEVFYGVHRRFPTLTLTLILPDCFSVKVDEGVYMAFAGVSADGRVLASKIRLECQSYRYSMGAAPSIDYIARYVGEWRQHAARAVGRVCRRIGWVCRRSEDPSVNWSEDRSGDRSVV